MMEAVRTSETSVDNHFTRQYNPEDSSEHIAKYLTNAGVSKLFDTQAAYDFTFQVAGQITQVLMFCIFIQITCSKVIACSQLPNMWLINKQIDFTLK
jgi:hypothetical protein